MSTATVHEPETVLFVSSTYKGDNMLRAVKAAGCNVLLLTEEQHRGKPWPFDVIDEIFYTPDLAHYQDVMHTVAYLCRGRQIHWIVPLDEFEVELVAMMREHLRLPGMGTSLTRHFRDKLTMRELARDGDIPVPAFIGVKNYDDLRAYMAATPAPWVLKPRSEASAMGIRKIDESEQLWRALDELGDTQSYYLLEQFVPGAVYHVDSVVNDGQIAFTCASKYGTPPLSVYQGGGVFMSRVLPRAGEESTALRALNERLIQTLSMVNGVVHAEYIRAEADGTIYFLEAASRVGGANLADMIAAATGVDLWQEWGRLVVAKLRGEPYQLPQAKDNYAGLLMTLARQENPDLSGYNDAEVTWRAHKDYHAGLIVASEDYARVEQLLTAYIARFQDDFMAVADPWGPQRTGR